jgi:hypothetical protein
MLFMMAAVRKGAQCLALFITNGTIGYRLDRITATNPMQQGSSKAAR